MKAGELIDIRAHAEVSCWTPGATTARSATARPTKYLAPAAGRTSPRPSPIAVSARSAGVVSLSTAKPGRAGAPS